jgi:hypothetical protein
MTQSAKLAKFSKALAFIIKGIIMYSIFQISWGVYSSGQKVAMYTRQVAQDLSLDQAIQNAQGLRQTYISESFVVTGGV